MTQTISTRYRGPTNTKDSGIKPTRPTNSETTARPEIGARLIAGGNEMLMVELCGVVDAVDRPGYVRAVVKLAGGDTYLGDGRTKAIAIRAARNKARKSYGATHTILLD